MENEGLHRPVMADEVIEFLCLKNGQTILDATIGCGGHACRIAQKIAPDGALIGIDRDRKSLDIARKRLEKFQKITRLFQSNFIYLDEVLRDLRIEGLDGALFDFGISSFQLEDPSRGFSFEKEGFLDMRMDPSQGLRAYDIVNRYRRQELEKLVRDYGEERYYKRVVDYILDRRRKSPITSTLELSDIVKSAVGAKYRSQKIHPATRVFQALRIAVNDELENIAAALKKVLNFLRPGGRICAISFHSLEDRIVKRSFKNFEEEAAGRIITKKPRVPSEGEIRQNPRARSAKLRVFER